MQTQQAYSQDLADWLLEREIRTALDQFLAGQGSWKVFVDLVGQRSPEQIERMEKAMGLSTH